MVVVWSSMVSPHLGGYGGAGGSSLVLQGVPSARGYGGAGGSSLVLQGVPSARRVWRGWW